MNRPLTIALLILLACLLLGGFKSIRNSLARESMHTLYREIIKH